MKSLLPKPNDKYYIGPQPDEVQIQKALSLGHRYKINEVKEETYFPETIKNYRIYIRMLTELLQELNLPRNPLYYAIVLQRIIYRGFCSIKDYKYDENVSDILCYTSGINVISGKGVCRNSTSFIQDTLKKLEFPTEKFYCNTFRTQYQRQNKELDHVLNIITINGVKYGYDSTNKHFLRFINSTDLQTYLPNGQRFIAHFKPYAAIIAGDDLEDIFHKLATYHEASISSQISEEEVNKIIISATQIVNQNENLFKEFKKETETQKQKILTLAKKETKQFN